MKCYLCKYSGKDYVPGWFLCRRRKYKTVSNIKNCKAFKEVKHDNKNKNMGS